MILLSGVDLDLELGQRVDVVALIEVILAVVAIRVMTMVPIFHVVVQVLHKEEEEVAVCVVVKARVFMHMITYIPDVIIKC